MKWDSGLTNLRDVLAALYPTVQDSRRVVQQSGLNLAMIAFDTKATTNWHEILQEAQKHNKIQAIIEVAQKEYPEDELLALAKQKGLTAVRGPDIEDRINWQGEKNTEQLEKIIGRQSTLLPISFLESGLEKSRSVVRVVRPDGTIGSGFLTDHNLLLTNHHVLPTPAEAQQAIIQFNYQQTDIGLDRMITKFKLTPDQTFATSKEDDWTVVKVQGDATQAWGGLQLTRVHLQKGDRVIIIQHPGGGPKQIAFYHNVVVYVDDKRIQYLTDTLPGSSGSPVFDHKWNVVALHHSGGWLREPGSKQEYYRNEGIHIHAVIDGLIQDGLYPGV